MPKARVTLHLEGAQKDWELHTNSKGYASFAGLASGTYTLVISAPGFDLHRQTLRVHDHVELEVTLDLAATMGALVELDPMPIPLLTSEVPMPEIQPVAIQPIPKETKSPAK